MQMSVDQADVEFARHNGGGNQTSPRVTAIMPFQGSQGFQPTSQRRGNGGAFLPKIRETFSEFFAISQRRRSYRNEPGLLALIAK